MNIKLITLTTTIFLISSLTACSEPAQVRQAEFSTLASCLAGLERQSGGNLNIITDKPAKVSGKLSNGEHFTCERVESGTKGTYFKGWFTVKDN
ncbi:hypothetical protein ACR0ST_01770 [Aliidiomarina sp. Khilg15.8]